MKLAGLVMIFVGLAASASGFATVAHQPETLGMDGLGVAGLVAVGLGIGLVVWKSRPPVARGFEVKSITGKTPVLQKKEVDHG